MMKSEKITVMGLGYVGLPLTVLLAEKGYSVFGYDPDVRKVMITNEGKSHLKDAPLEKRLYAVKEHLHATTDACVIADSSIVVVSVPTPVDTQGQANLTYVISAAETIKKHVKKGQLISIESTVLPGTCTQIVLPILNSNAQGLVCGRDFYMCHCPERIDPGNIKYPLEKVPRVLGASDSAGLEKAFVFYSSFINEKIRKVSSVETAETVKVVENAFRALNIGFVNELAKAFDNAHVGIDFIEVINAAADKPYGFLAHYPGPGVGGDCIDIVGKQLVDFFKKSGIPIRTLQHALETNGSMPVYTIDRIAEGLNAIERPICNTPITVLGVAYKKNVDDIRESPALKIIRELQNRGAALTIYDPFVPSHSTVQTLEEALVAQCIVICTDHDEFKMVTGQRLKEAGVKVVVDTKACLNKKELIEQGIIYRGIGR